MSEHLTLRTAIVAKLLTVTDIGTVHSFERNARDEAGFREIYAAGERVQGWHVRRVSRREGAEFNQVFTDWEIRGFMSIEDAVETELLFDTLLDAICDAWRADPTLGGAVLYPMDDASGVPVIADAGPVLFAGVLCHSVRLKLTTRHVCDAGRPWD